MEPGRYSSSKPIKLQHYECDKLMEDFAERVRVGPIILISRITHRCCIYSCKTTKESILLCMLYHMNNLYITWTVLFINMKSAGAPPLLSYQPQWNCQSMLTVKIVRTNEEFILPIAMPNMIFLRLTPEFKYGSPAKPVDLYFSRIHVYK